MLAPVSRTARLEDQLGLDDEKNSIIADGGATRPAGRPPRAATFRVAPPSAICQLPASARPSRADSPISVFCANAPRKGSVFSEHA
eukprot:scaffold3241_cov64-Phaeocystis_antarctica.AAC.3